MSCCNPVTHTIITKNGSRRVVTHGCGQCEACLKKRQKDWIFRCNWEARKHPYNWVVTLTYSDEFLTFTEKGNATLNKDDFQRFMKRLRADFPYHKLRYLVRGEYGGKFGRPHMHMILFGLPARSCEEVGFHISQQWKYGGVFVDSYSDRAVNYVTSYLLKADDLSVYEDDEIVRPYINVSQRPAIGANFLTSQTAKRAQRTNNYIMINENQTKLSIPRYLANKLDDEVTDNPFEKQFRKYNRPCVFTNGKESTHYSADYLVRKQVDRAAAIQAKKHKDYLNNKCK